MKKTILILGMIVATMMSCEKENVEPNDGHNPQYTDCGCGEVIERYNGEPINDYLTIQIRNNCTKNIKYKTFETNGSFWNVDINIGDEWCNTDGGQW